MFYIVPAKRTELIEEHVSLILRGRSIGPRQLQILLTSLGSSSDLAIPLINRVLSTADPQNTKRYADLTLIAAVHAVEVYHARRGSQAVELLNRNELWKIIDRLSGSIDQATKA